MARIDYFGIEIAIKAVLEADANLGGVSVLVERPMDLNFAIGNGLVIGIYMTSRNAPDEQPIAGGKRAYIIVEMKLICRSYGTDSLEAVIRRRDDLIGNVELALLGTADKTLGDTVRFFYLQGGEMVSGEDPDFGYLSEGEVTVMAEAIVIAV